MKEETEEKVFAILLSMSPFLFTLTIGIISRPDKWIDLSFVMWLLGLILFPFAYIVVHNINPVGEKE